MTLSDVLDNAASAIIAAPVAIEIAAGLQVGAEPSQSAGAIAASCAFLTPIGQDKSLILGTGGYAFGDCWRMGLPPEVILLAVGVPAILLAWPF